MAAARKKTPTISIPKMKSGRSFDLPLSAHMVGIVERVLAIGDVLYPKTDWLFPTIARKDEPRRGVKKGDVIATQVWREKSLPSETGHLLRHTFRTIAQREQIDKIEARLLLDHTVPGIDGDCGGACACATCHVYVENGWLEKLPPMNELERDMLDFAFDVRGNSRLSCQIKVSPALEGLVVRTPARQY